MHSLQANANTNDAVSFSINRKNKYGPCKIDRFEERKKYFVPWDDG